MNGEDRLREAMRSLLTEDPPPGLIRSAIERLPPGRPRQPTRLVGILATFVVLFGAVATLAIISRLDSDRGPLGNLSSDPPGHARPSPTPFLASAAPNTLAPTAASPTQAPSTPASEASVDVVQLAEPERSEHYWRRVTHFGPYSYTFDSLAAMTAEAHLVLRGRVSDTRIGEIQPFDETFPAYQEVFGIVEVLEVLKGEPEMRVEGYVEVARLGWGGIDRGDLPGQEAIFFLMNYAQLRQDHGSSSSGGGEDSLLYSRPNGYQAILPIVDGRINVIVPSPVDRQYAQEFPAQLDGLPLADIQREFRELVERPSAP